MARRTLSLEELDGVLEGLTGIEGTTGSIGIADSALSGLIRVLEFGSIAGQKPWPRPGARTVLAVDPDSGRQIVVTAQAPQGFIRSQLPAVVSRFRDELSRQANWLDPDGLQAHLQQAVRNATQAALTLIRESVPGDSTKLAETLVAE